ncbi:unnamed protein product, partial [Amoebophrya sp. A25]
KLFYSDFGRRGDQNAVLPVPPPHKLHPKLIPSGAAGEKPFHPAEQSPVYRSKRHHEIYHDSDEMTACLQYQPPSRSGDESSAALSRVPSRSTRRHEGHRFYHTKCERGEVLFRGGFRETSAERVFPSDTAAPLPIRRITRGVDSNLVSYDGNPVLDPWLEEGAAPQPEFRSSSKASKKSKDAVQMPPAGLKSEPPGSTRRVDGGHDHKHHFGLGTSQESAGSGLVPTTGGAREEVDGEPPARGSSTSSSSLQHPQSQRTA